MGSPTKSKIVFIDRDGVINVDPIGDYIKSWEEFRFEKGALSALKKICDAGFEIFLISNQAGVGDGVFSEEALWDIHDKMLAELKKNGISIKAAFYCLHGKQAGCSCRKPEIGLFKKAVEGISYNPDKTFFVGDKASDVQAGKRFGLKTIFLRTGHGQFDEVKLKGEMKPDYVFDHLEQAVKVLIS